MDDNPNDDNAGSGDDSSEFIPFYPTEMDVVATKIRTWNSKHPGNQFYTNVIQGIIQNETTILESPTDFRRAAEHVHHIICVQRGGRFLKLPEGLSSSVVCTVMSEQNVINKVIHALKTARKRKELRDAGVIPPPFIKATLCGLQPFKINHKKPRPDMMIVDEDELVTSPAPPPPTPHGKKKQSPGTVKKPNHNDSPTSIPRPKKRIKVTYEAVIVGGGGDKNNDPNGPLGTLHTYALKLISRVCSQLGDPRTAHYSLDRPNVMEYTIHTEPDQQRFLRLQLRQRFAAAVAVGITPLEFARKLLKMWGGELRQVIVELQPPPLPPPIAKVTTTPTPKKQSMTTPDVDTTPGPTTKMSMEHTPYTTLLQLQLQLQLQRNNTNPSPSLSGEEEATRMMVVVDNVDISTSIHHQEATKTHDLELQEPAIEHSMVATPVPVNAPLSHHQQSDTANDLEQQEAAIQSSFVAVPVPVNVDNATHHETTDTANHHQEPAIESSFVAVPVQVTLDNMTLSHDQETGVTAIDLELQEGATDPTMVPLSVPINVNNATSSIHQEADMTIELELQEAAAGSSKVSVPVDDDTTPPAIDIPNQPALSTMINL
jgi:hypothetical protein